MKRLSSFLICKLPLSVAYRLDSSVNNSSSIPGSIKDNDIPRNRLIRSNDRAKRLNEPQLIAKLLEQFPVDKTTVAINKWMQHIPDELQEALVPFGGLARFATSQSNFFKVHKENGLSVVSLSSMAYEICQERASREKSAAKKAEKFAAKRSKWSSSYSSSQRQFNTKNMYREKQREHENRKEDVYENLVEKRNQEFFEYSKILKRETDQEAFKWVWVITTLPNLDFLKIILTVNEVSVNSNRRIRLAIVNAIIELFFSEKENTVGSAFDNRYRLLHWTKILVDEIKLDDYHL